jgi:hypothetical protein
MSAKKPTPAPMPSDELLLAAIERAERHHRHDHRGALLATIKEHLHLDKAGWTTIRLRPKLEALATAGLSEEVRRNSLTLWAITEAGRASLRALGDEIELPESPQHRRWREAREAAAERIEPIREEVRVALTEANALLDADPLASSEAWFDLSETLQDACWRLASATYCLGEWEEPDDALADLDEVPSTRRGRREVRRWARSRGAPD